MPQSALTKLPLTTPGWGDFLNQGWKIGSTLSQLIEIVWNTILKNIWEPQPDSVRKTAMTDWQCLPWAGEGKLMACVLRVCQRQHPFYFLKEKKSTQQTGLKNFSRESTWEFQKLTKAGKISTRCTLCLKKKNIREKITCITCMLF